MRLPAGAFPPAGRAAGLSPSPGSQCQFCRSTLSSPAPCLALGAAGQMGTSELRRRVSILWASPPSQIQSRVPFPAPCAGVSARVCARASVSGKRVCAGEYAEGAQAAGGAGGGRQGAGEGAGRECVRACNSTPGLCASPGDSIGGGWRRSGRRRVQARSAAGAGGKPAREPSRHEPETPQPSPSGARAEPRSTRSQAARGRQPRRGGRRRGGPPVRCAQRRGAPPTRRGAREPGSWARRRLGGCCSPAPRAAAPGSPPRPRPGHARWRPTMTAPWRRLRSLVWEYWAGLLVCAFWIPDSRGMPHVIRIGKGSPGAGGLCALGWGRELEWGCSERDPRDCPNLPLGCRARMSAGSSWWRGQSSKARVAGLTYGEEATGLLWARGPRHAPGKATRWSVAKVPDPTPCLGGILSRLSAWMAADRVLGLVSVPSGSPGEGDNFSPLVAPPPMGSSPELGDGRGQGVQGMDSPNEGS